MPKKPAPNGYYYFMLDFKRSEERQGRRFPGGMPEVSAAASDDWRALPQAEKERYNKLAKERKNEPRPNMPNADEKRFNSQGVSFADLKRKKAKAEEKLKRESNFITQFVDAMSEDDLHHKLIYLIHVNIFCKTDNNIYYPAEIGIVKFSLEDGVKDYFHRFVDPGEFATGYKFAAKEHSEQTHKLTLPFVKSIAGTSDFHRYYQDICKFLTEDEDGDNIPPLFTMYDDVIKNTSMTAVKKTLKSLWETAYASSNDTDEDCWESFFKVLPLPDMFQRLKNKCALIHNSNVIAFPNPVLPKIELLKDTYQYDSSTACKFHRDEDVIVHCSKAFVCRWAFIIRDHCTDLIGIDMFKGNTVPESITNDGHYSEYEEDDTRSLVESLQSVQMSEASIDFSSSTSRNRYVGGSSLKKSKIKSGEKEDEDGSVTSVKYDRSASKSHSYAAVSNASGRKDTGESLFNEADEDDDFDVNSSVSVKKGKDNDQESDASQSVKSCPVAWPSINRRPQNTVPVMNENTFPSLGRGRGRGSLRSLSGN